MSGETDATFGICERCGGHLSPVIFTEYEEKVTGQGWRYKTGRWRRAVSHLTCDTCLKNYCVDDSFDGPWHN